MEERPRRANTNAILAPNRGPISASGYKESADSPIAGSSEWVGVDLKLCVPKAQSGPMSRQRAILIGGGSFREGQVGRGAVGRQAAQLLRDAARTFSEASIALPACRARMELARTLVDSDRPVAISEARAALAAFERLGAVPDANAASAFLRDLGVKGRTGPKNLELLSKRELEVLRLVAQGLSNSEIAERLFISTKTAGHHVSSIRSKLGLRSRTEAAAFAALNLGREPAQK